jgi:hypothetical protein
VKEETMTVTNTRFQMEKAPCGQNVPAEHFQDQDEEGLVTDRWNYACGCRNIRQEYHDGSVHNAVVRHDGKVLTEELLGKL